jgi:hypothetical protein
MDLSIRSYNQIYTSSKQIAQLFCTTLIRNYTATHLIWSWFWAIANSKIKFLDRILLVVGIWGAVVYLGNNRTNSYGF